MSSGLKAAPLLASRSLARQTGKVLLSALSVTFCLPVVTGGAAQAKPDAKAAPVKAAPRPKQYIFSLSNTPTESDALSCSGVPAQVNFPNGSQRRGAYVMKADPGTPASHMGLIAGTVILSVEDKSTPTMADVDNALAQHPSGRVKYYYVRMERGLPKLQIGSTVLVNKTTQQPAADGNATKH